jgi:hypothetical protein
MKFQEWVVGTMVWSEEEDLLEQQEVIDAVGMKLEELHQYRS